MPRPTTADDLKAVVIYCQNGGYWRPLSNGYTYSLLEAGVYFSFEPWRQDDKIIPIAEAFKDLGALEWNYVTARCERDVAAHKAKTAASEEKSKSSVDSRGGFGTGAGPDWDI